ncbi:MAG: hypothetical protein JWM32_540 [Verrucomicrobia bacterium]|nr:hypothetical protein [Verrucomicrobiota bacterium]
MTSFTDGNGKTIKYQYDDLGRLTRLTYPGNRAVDYAYDVAGSLERVTDWAGRTTRYEYDVVGRILECRRPNGTRQLREYDRVGRLSGLREIGSGGLSEIFEGEYNYDPSDQLTQEAVSPAPDVGIEDTTQAFDLDNRLRTHAGHPVTYDVDGNLTAVGGLGEKFRYEFDARNRLSRNGDSIYGYDAEDHRVAVTDSSGTTDFVINPNAELDQVLMKTDPDGTETYYVYGLGLLHQQTGDSVRYYHFDRRGDTVALTDENGGVTDRWSYGPYGEIRGRSGATHTPFLFSGEWGVQTEAAGLSYHRARYYNSELRRFLNQDPLLGSVAMPATLNRYAYAGGNPVRFIDPSGYYNRDVHHDLTYGLATKAGFSPAEATAIAGSDQGVDDSLLTGPYLWFGSRSKYHFTTPERREEMLEAANSTDSLDLFGKYLHAEQDSYAHQRGLTDRDGKPYGSILGHAGDGGAPDLTHLRPELAVKMAEDTYQQLRKFFAKIHGTKTCDDWENLRAEVDQWARTQR